MEERSIEISGSTLWLESRKISERNNTNGRAFSMTSRHGISSKFSDGMANGKPGIRDECVRTSVFDRFLAGLRLLGIHVGASSILPAEFDAWTI